MTNLETGTVPERGASELGLRERKKQQTRRAIHEAAFRLIDERGLEATTVEQICVAAEVSSRTFFNYFSSKTAAALELPTPVITAESAARFRAASGSLIDAIADLVGHNSMLGASHGRMKKLITHRPELVATLSQIMLEARGQFVSLVAERTESREQAELAVTLVMVALSRIIHSENYSDELLNVQLKTIIDNLAAMLNVELVELVQLKNSH